MRHVVADTGPILHLGEASILDLLNHTGHVAVPPRVSVEVASFTAARLFAQQQGFEVHGSLGVLLWAAEYKIIEKAAAESAFDRLAQSSLWLSPRALAHARTLLDKIFPGA